MWRGRGMVTGRCWLHYWCCLDLWCGLLVLERGVRQSGWCALACFWGPFTSYVFQHLVYLLSMDSQPFPFWTPWGSAQFSHTLCLVVPCSALEGSPFSCFLFPEFFGELRSGLRKCLPCNYLGAPLVSEGVCLYWHGSKFFGVSNGDLDAVIPFWQGLCL